MKIGIVVVADDTEVHCSEQGAMGDDEDFVGMLVGGFELIEELLGTSE